MDGTVTQFQHIPLDTIYGSRFNLNYCTGVIGEHFRPPNMCVILQLPQRSLNDPSSSISEFCDMPTPGAAGSGFWKDERTNSVHFGLTGPLSDTASICRTGNYRAQKVFTGCMRYRDGHLDRDSHANSLPRHQSLQRSLRWSLGRTPFGHRDALVPVSTQVDGDVSPPAHCRIWRTSIILTLAACL